MKPSNLDPSNQHSAGNMNLNRRLSLSLIACIAVLALAACSKSEPAAPVVTLPSHETYTPTCNTMACRQDELKKQREADIAQAVADQKAAAAAGPHPDFAKPDSAYAQPKTNFDYGVLWQAFGSKLSDRDLGERFSSVAGESDQFKKAEKLKVAVDQMTAAVAAQGGNRYVVLKNVGVTLKPYDMTAKGFKVDGIEGMVFGLRDSSTSFSSSLAISNGDAVNTWKPDDEQVARATESARSSYRLNISADLYTFIAGVVPGSDSQLNAVVTKVVIHDDKGAVLAALVPAAK